MASSEFDFKAVLLFVTVFVDSEWLLSCLQRYQAGSQRCLPAIVL
jgi:hypothetical protein